MVRREFPEAQLLTPGTNLGAVGRNLGVEAVTCPYVAFCDDDTWYDDGALGRAADLLDGHLSLAVVTARIVVEPSGRVDPICHEMARSPLPQPEGLPGSPLLSFLAGVSIVRRTAFLAAGGFSSRLWLGGEEELLACDLVRDGWHLAYVEDVVAHHQPSTAREWHLRRRHGIRNTLWFTWLRRPWPAALRRTGLMARAVPKDRVSLLGFADALLGAGWVRRERRVVPPEMEHGYRLLEAAQMKGGTRRYVS
jgi:GT2 family glycosyltransferase